MKLIRHLGMLSPGSTQRTDVNTTATSVRQPSVWRLNHLISPERISASPPPPTPFREVPTAVVTPVQDRPTRSTTRVDHPGTSDNSNDSVPMAESSIIGTKPDQVERRMHILSPKIQVSARVAQLVDIILMSSYGTATLTTTSSNSISGSGSNRSINNRADAPPLWNALDELAALLRPDPRQDGAAVRVALFRACGHLAVVKAMQHHRACPNVQNRGCHILSHLCCCKGANGENYNLDEIGGIRELGLGLGVVGTMEAVMQAMKIFPERKSVQSFCMTALSNLSYFDKNEQVLVMPLASGSNDKKGNEDKKGDHGVALVLKSMTTFPDEEVIQHHGCRVLKHVCKGSKHIPLVKQANGIVVVAAVLQHFSKSSHAFEQANKVMKLILNE